MTKVKSRKESIDVMRGCVFERERERERKRRREREKRVYVCKRNIEGDS